MRPCSRPRARRDFTPSWPGLSGNDGLNRCKTERRGCQAQDRAWRQDCGYHCAMVTALPKPLRKFSGRLVLLGAGKMGSAMLDGWLARGVKLKQITVIEPQPGKAIKAL